MHNEATNLIPVNAMVRDKSEFERLELVSSMRRVAEDAARQWEKLADNLEKSGRPY